MIGFYEAPQGGGIALGSAGFPTSSGNPYNEIKMNTHPEAYGANPDLLYVASVIQHELGHCIGLRHTDYMNRAFSCGNGGNEGIGDVGAINIPGTPTDADAGSWMLACTTGGNRTFNNNDIIALNYLYSLTTYINGSLILCTGNIAEPDGGDYTYTLENIPAGTTLAWSTQPGIKIVGSNTGNSVIVRHNPVTDTGKSFANLNVTISYPDGSVISRYIRIGLKRDCK
ncbi:M57 family metalloprotease [Pedobacter sp. NJ-S-72]